MISVAAVALSLAAAASAAYIETSAGLTECASSTISFGGDAAPYYVAVLTGQNPCDNDAYEEFLDVYENTVQYTPTGLAGTQVQLYVEDANGNEAYSEVITIGSCQPEVESSSSSEESSSTDSSSTDSSSSTVSSASSTTTERGTLVVPENAADAPSKTNTLDDEDVEDVSIQDINGDKEDDNNSSNTNTNTNKTKYSGATSVGVHMFSAAVAVSVAAFSLL